MVRCKAVPCQHLRGVEKHTSREQASVHYIFRNRRWKVLQDLPKCAAEKITTLYSICGQTDSEQIKSDVWRAITSGVSVVRRIRHIVNKNEELTSQPQNFSTQLRGGGSSYDAASTSARPDLKSMSSGRTNVVRRQMRAPMYMIGNKIKGR